ncbi:MAG: beta-ketoacyl synthase N-terminal-like domain-containing protein, partial [Pseudomonadota bacterium]
MSRYDIAIIGMGCLFPHANTLERYWQNVLDGDSYFEPMPKHLWRLDNFCSPSRAVREKSYTTLGAFIDLKIDFPFLEYRLPPKSMEGMDPAQLVSLYATRQALLDAGIEPRSEALHDAVTIIGASGVDGFAHTTTYLRRHRFFAELRAELSARGVSDSQIASLEAEFGPALKARGHGWDPANAAVGNVPSSISNRIAQVFGIRGYNMTVDGACASSFVALNVACQALCAGDARVVVTGGCDLGTNPGIYVGFAQMEGLSITGHSNPFDHTADGLVIGEGVGIVVLKRIEDAVADGDRVRAVIRGIGTSSDGAGQAIYAPSVPGRVKSFKTALSNAGTRPREVQYLEGHATSTIVGDAVEYDAIAETYAHDREGVPPLLVGSVKHQIGHLKAAAGMAGLIKTVLAMGHGTFPHMPRFTKLTPEAHNPSDAIAVPTSPSAWVPHADGRRVAAITASGFGGVNYHVIVEQAERYSPPATRPRPARDMAVVAITLRVPGAADVETFWSNVTAGKDVFTPVKGPEIGWHDHLDAGPENERITTHVVGRLEQYDFNYLKHRIFPKSVSQISPTQFLGLDLGERLLDAAGIDIRAPKAIGVSVGTMHDDHYPTLCSPMFADEYAETIRECAAARGIGSAVLDPALAEAGQRFKAQDPPITEHTLPGWMTNVTAGRMANKLNLQGPNFTVDSACSSGVAALVPAVYQLMFGNVDAMITGGFNRQLSAEFTAGVCTLGAVAEWVPRPFDEAGRGFLIGEGGAVYLLKRLADAQRDGDDIVAVLRAVGGSSEADSKSMVAPSELAVRRSIADALRHTVVRGDEIHVVDVHGSANPVSDITEARSLAAELRADGGEAPPVQITAIKSHIGHLYGGSGATSMLSTIQALRTRSVPGIRNLEKLRPELADILAKAEPRKGTRPLAAGAMSGGVNSLGLGGANYFAILTLPEGMQAAVDAAPAKAPAAPAPVAPVAPVSAATLDGVFLRGAGDLAALVPVLRAAQEQPGLPWLDPAAWADPVRIAVAAGDRVVLGQRLAAAEKMLSRGMHPGPLESQGVFCAQQEPAQPLPGLALCFPGQGVHYVGMGKPLYARDPAFRAVLDRVDALARQAFGFALLEHIHGPEGDAGVERELGTLVGAQTSLFALEVALGRHLLAEGLTPDVFIGHSFGEICALAVAGVWDLDVAFQVVVERIRAAELVARSGGPALGMMSLLCTERQRDALLALAGEAVMLTNVNAPGRYVLAGVRQAIEHCAEGARIFGAEAAVLPIGGAFHSPWMEPAREPFRQALAALPCRRGSHRVLSTVSGAYLEPEALTPGFLAEHLSGQLTTPLNLPREVETLYRDGVRHFLEVGPRWAMTRMVEGILEDRPHRACFCLHPKLGDDESLRRAHAFLAALGHLRGSDSPVAAGLEPEFLAFLAQADPSVYARLVELQRRFVEAPPAPRGSHQGAGAEVSLFPTPSSGESPAAPAASADAWVARLKARLVATTGYPEDMLEPELDLEADLGIDSVQRAEIWMALLNEHGLDPSARPSGPRTIANLARCLAGLTPGGAPEPPAPKAPPAPLGSHQGAGAEASLFPTPSSGGSPPAPAASAEAWVARLKARLVATTGYPEDMLEPELDLEADLGIDSVQRAEIWMALLNEHGLDPAARPSGPRTIANRARCLAALVPGGEPVAAPAPAPAPAPAAPAGPVAAAPEAAVEAPDVTDRWQIEVAAA